MKASEYIEHLRRLMDIHGDLECVDSEDEQIGSPEEIEGVFVLADRA